MVKKPKTADNWEQAFREASLISFSLVFSAVTFLFIGVILDKWLSTKPLFIVTGVTAGFIIMFIKILRLEKKMRK